MHPRSTNPTESVFAIVRLRTYRTKGSGSVLACATMVFKLIQSASKRWRALDGPEFLGDVIAGVTSIDEIKDNAANQLPSTTFGNTPVFVRPNDDCDALGFYFRLLKNLA